ncbi:3-oxoadipate enol-lactonase [Actibacterium ureilyticum]|uniref:3-oxoadipate enol-lactonase n=1 Tax=Actibacterium ureilyticum TaxID=1590614 RepID=UPI000BAAD54D|nr:3-oxoadipate enol-lactonase [Actibacterium ureilyticum]
MPFVDLNGLRLHYRADGPADGPPVVFANAICTNLHLWDAVLAHLPPGLRLIRYDMRGHGHSDCPPPPYAMGQLVRDAEGLLDHLDVRDCVFVGLSLGGFVAQGLAVKRLDQIRALVLSNTAAKLGQPAQWQARIDALHRGGMTALADTTLPAWFTRAFRAGPDFAAWRERFLAQDVQGVAGCLAAISGTDFYTPTSGLRLPTLGIAGSEDGATPADLVRETVGLIPGSRFELIRRAGHLPCVEQPAEFARLLLRFLKETGHV